MSTDRTLMRQGTQRTGPGYSLGFISSTLRPTSQGGGIAARFGISSASGRHTVELGPGDSSPLPGGGSLEVLEIFVSPDGAETAAAVTITVGRIPTA